MIEIQSHHILFMLLECFVNLRVVFKCARKYAAHLSVNVQLVLYKWLTRFVKPSDDMISFW